MEEVTEVKIPPPTRKLSPQLEAVHALKRGESHFLEGYAAKRCAMIAWRIGKRTGIKYRCRSEPGGVRIYRVT